MKLEVLAATMVVCSVAACADLPAPGVCGNGVHEPELGEDCDDGTDSERCTACRLVCDRDAPAETCVDGFARCCPAGAACGVDGLCSYPAGAVAFPATVIDYAPSVFQVIDVDGDGLGDVTGIASDRLQARFGSSAADLGRLFEHRTPPFTPGARVAMVESPSPDFTGEVVVLPTPDGISVLLLDGTQALPLPTPALIAEAASFANVAVTCNSFECGLAAVGNAPTGEVVLVVHDAYELGAPCGAISAAETTIAALTTTPGRPDIVVVGAGQRLCLYLDDRFPGQEVHALFENLVVSREIAAFIPIQLDSDSCQEALVLYASTGPADAEYTELDIGNCANPEIPGSVTAFTTNSVQLRPIAAGDLDGAGDWDLVTPSSVTFSSGAVFPFPTGHEVFAATIIDLNRDGVRDIVGINVDFRLEVMLGLGGGTYLVQTRDELVGALVLDAADLDGDLYGDIVVRDVFGQLWVLHGGPSGIGEPVLFGAIDALGGLDVSARIIAGELHADVTMLQASDSMGGEAIRFRAYPNRAIAPISPLPFGRAEGSLAGELRPGSLDVGVLGVSRVGLEVVPRLRVFVIPDASAVVSTGAPYLVAVDDPDGYFLTYPGVGERPPWFESIRVGDEPRLLAMRRAPDELEAVTFALPAPPGPGGEVETPSARVPLLPPGDGCLIRTLERLRPVQFDADTDTELVASVTDTCDEQRECGCTRDAHRLFLIDFGSATAPAATDLTALLAGVSGEVFDCTDGAAIELGEPPEGMPAAAGPQEVVAACTATFADEMGGFGFDVLVGFFSQPGGAAAAQPFQLTFLPYAGELAIGDITGDGVDDVAIRSAGGQLGVAAQCARHDVSTCVSSN